jgi:hypothetical protein
LLIFLRFCLLSIAFVAFQSGRFWRETGAGVQLLAGTQRRAKLVHPLMSASIFKATSTLQSNEGIST